MALRLRHAAGTATAAWRKPVASRLGRQLADRTSVTASLGTATRVTQQQPSPDAPPAPSGGRSRRVWDEASCLSDHEEVFAALPRILGAYVGPNALSPALGESVMVAVNSAKACPYCEGLHGNLARLAGVDNAALQAAASVADCTAVVDDPAIAYARVFAEHNGRGPEVDAAYDAVVLEHGEGRAGSVRALCWFLTWGALGGNTLNGALFGTNGPRTRFDLAFAAYYSPLFAVIAAMNFGLARAPSPMPPAFFAGMGVTLTVAGGAWLTPVAILAHVRGAP